MRFEIVFTLRGIRATISVLEVAVPGLGVCIMPVRPVAVTLLLGWETLGTELTSSF